MNWSSFFDEMDKIAFDVQGHTALARPTAQSMGAGGGMGELITSGSLATDKGIRHPWLPSSHAEHAFPSQSKGDISRNMMKTRQQGVRDVSKAIAKGGPLAGMRTTRGMMDLGQAQHGVMDIATHFERPLESGATGAAAPSIRGRVAKRVRSGLQKVPGAGPLGFAVSGMEHGNAGLKAGEGLQPGSHLDTYRPGATPSDVRSANRAAGFGRAARRDIIKDMQTTHGMSPAQAEASYARHMNAPAPGRVSQALGRTTRNVRYVGQQAARPVVVAGKAARTAGRVAARPVAAAGRAVARPVAAAGRVAARPVASVGRAAAGRVAAKIKIPSIKKTVGKLLFRR